ncbi:nicotinate-nucleotide--dimethylbenzimidazole phosphoribosyltransferase [Hydrogenophaga soli]
MPPHPDPSSAVQLPTVEPIASPTLTAALQQRVDSLAKPVGSLGRMESLARQIGLIQQTTTPTLQTPQVVLFAGDHGIVDEGVSLYPQRATVERIGNVLGGGAAVSVLARDHGWGLTVVDAGVAAPIPPAPHTQGQPTASLLSRKIGFGTRNMAHAPAMTGQRALAALGAGMDVMHHLPGNVVAIGDIGVGNSSSAALLLSRLCAVPLEDAVGRGYGLSDRQMEHKLRLLFDVMRKHRNAHAPLAILAALGGFEIAMMVGAMLQAASERRVILVDGFVAGAAALLARELRPAVTDYMVFSHRSTEQGHRLMLIHLQALPLLDLEIALGEGTGALLAWPLLQSAVRLMNHMALANEAELSPPDTPATPLTTTPQPQEPPALPDALATLV